MQVNGGPADVAAVTCSRRVDGRKWTVRFRLPEQLEVNSVSLVVRDDALLRNRVRFSVSVERAATIVSGKEYSKGTAVALVGASAFLKAQVELAAGTYDVEVLGFGPNSGANSLFVELDGTRMADVVHLPERTVGVASRFVEHDPEAMPVLKVSTAGKHTLVFVLCEGPPQTIDRVRILREGKAVATIETDTVLPVSPRP